jgi:hypothetical protein
LILTSRFSYKVKDVETMIQRKLISSPSDALRFGTCVQKLRELQTMKNINPILTFLFGLSNQQKIVGDQSILKLGLTKLQLEKEEEIVIPVSIEKKASVFNRYYDTTKKSVTERELIRELLFNFQGIDGKWIRFNISSKQFEIDKCVCFYNVD